MRPILKRGGQKGSDPFARRALQYQELLETRGQCETTWMARGLDDHTVHRCARHRRHGANHGCACGAKRAMPRSGVGRN